MARLTKQLMLEGNWHISSLCTSADIFPNSVRILGSSHGSISAVQVKRSGVRGISTRADAECVFRHFAKQQDAFEYAEACNEAAANHSGEGPIDIVKVGA